MSKDRATVYCHVIRLITLSDRQHLVRLLAAHIQIYPRDYWAYTWLPKSSRQLVKKARALSGTDRLNIEPLGQTDDQSAMSEYLEPQE